MQAGRQQQRVCARYVQWQLEFTMAARVRLLPVPLSSPSLSFSFSLFCSSPLLYLSARSCCCCWPSLSADNPVSLSLLLLLPVSALFKISCQLVWRFLWRTHRHTHTLRHTGTYTGIHTHINRHTQWRSHTRPPSTLILSQCRSNNKVKHTPSPLPPPSPLPRPCLCSTLFIVFATQENLCLGAHAANSFVRIYATTAASLCMCVCVCVCWLCLPLHSYSLHPPLSLCFTAASVSAL